MVRASDSGCFSRVWSSFSLGSGSGVFGGRFRIHSRADCQPFVKVPDDNLRSTCAKLTKARIANFPASYADLPIAYISSV